MDMRKELYQRSVERWNSFTCLENIVSKWLLYSRLSKKHLVQGQCSKVICGAGRRRDAGVATILRNCGAGTGHAVWLTHGQRGGGGMRQVLGHGMERCTSKEVQKISS